MADRPAAHQIQVHPQHHGYDGGIKTLLPDKGPSTTQVLAVVGGLPVGGTLLGLAGLTLLGTLIALAVATPLLVIFSPVLVPATIILGLAVAGFLTSGASALSGLTSLSWVLSCLQQKRVVPENLDQAKRQMADMAGYLGQKTKDAGQEIQNRAYDVKRS